MNPTSQEIIKNRFNSSNLNIVCLYLPLILVYRFKMAAPCYLWTQNRCPFSDLTCSRPHNKDGMSLCLKWKRGDCIGMVGNSCRLRHYYLERDRVFIPISQSQQNIQSSLAFSSPLVERVCTVKESFRRVEIDIETGRRRSFEETKVTEIIDISGKENTPVAVKKCTRSDPEGILSKKLFSAPEPENEENPGLCLVCRKVFKGKRGLQSHKSSRVKCEAPVTPRKPALEDTVSTHTQQNDSIIIID
ncbi:uncharacterized protein LOC111703172 [Eurytemora carolleeae]|uniref:uncharacterized protein LOC111703172 n=1 Tax=Eurytemora carolleeae TaxID=1294199 RepID=UPI000C777573|nr:uncharacterized protein LOC111703172 [Eurytemora carolleeae]|eukprot:XP_023330815.1 uncharacterized protein LOC111703172 [Eurytemora affinis]